MVISLRRRINIYVCVQARWWHIYSVLVWLNNDSNNQVFMGKFIGLEKFAQNFQVSYLVKDFLQILRIYP